METSLCISDILILFAMASALGGIAALVLVRRRTERWVAPSGMHRAAALAFGLAVLAAAGTMAVKCPTGSFGACPAAIGGTGYRCPTPAPACGIISGTCKTVAGTMPWDSDCECKCI